MHTLDSKIVVSRSRCGRGKSDLGKMACERQKISWYRNSKHHLLSVEFLQKLMMVILMR